MKKVLLNLVFLFALVCFAEAQEFKVADIFSDNMVLQQKINNPFWGWGKPGTKVTKGYYCQPVSSFRTDDWN